MITNHKQESSLSAPKTYQLHKQGIEKQKWPAKRLLIVALPHSQSFYRDPAVLENVFLRLYFEIGIGLGHNCSTMAYCLFGNISSSKELS